MAGKGSKPRPLSVDYEEYLASWDNAFGIKKYTTNSLEEEEDQTDLPNDEDNL